MAKHIGLNNPVALKVLHAHLVAAEENVERFRREAEATSRLRHNAIAGVFDFGVLPDGRPYMVMEYLSGVSLADLLEAEGKLPVERVVPLFVECADALRYAHRKGLLHRDIKPDNIFVSRDIDGFEHAKLLDFGLAKIVFGDEGVPVNSLTESGTTLGTPWYMSPEQCQALPLDGRSDIYSLAYSLYEALNGKRAFPGTTHYDAMHAHLHKKPPPLNQPEQVPVVPPALEGAILRALSKSPNDRFMTADEFRLALIAAVPDLQATATLSPAVAPSAIPAASDAATRTATQEQTPKNVAKLSGGAKKAKRGRSSVATLIAVVASVLLLGVSAGFIWYAKSQSANKASGASKVTVSDSEADPGALMKGAPSGVPTGGGVTPPVVSSTQSARFQSTKPLKGSRATTAAPRGAVYLPPPSQEVVISTDVDTTRKQQEQQRLQNLESEITRLREEVARKSGTATATAETIQFPESSLPKNVHYLPVESTSGKTATSTTQTSEQPEESTVTNPAPPAGFPPLPPAGRRGLPGGPGGPGFPPPGYPGHVPPPGYPLPPGMGPDQPH